MRQADIERRQTGRGVAQRGALDDGGLQNKLVHRGRSRARAASGTGYQALASCWDLRASSFSTRFIIDDGPVSAFVATHRQVTQHGIVEAEAGLDLSQGFLAALDVQAQVVRLGQLVDQVGELEATPVLDTVDLAAQRSPGPCSVPAWPEPARSGPGGPAGRFHRRIATPWGFLLRKPPAASVTGAGKKSRIIARISPAGRGSRRRATTASRSGPAGRSAG